MRLKMEQQRDVAMVNEALAKALVAAQKAFSPALKTATNPQFKSKYAALDGCIEAVMDALNNNGIFLSQKTHNCESGVTVETLFIHESGYSYSAGVLHVPAGKNDAQGHGSALTYARRYSLMAACGIAPEDDDGNAAAAAPPSSELPWLNVNSPEWQRAIEYYQKAGNLKGVLLKYRISKENQERIINESE
jgi:hypothetical protein